MIRLIVSEMPDTSDVFPAKSRGAGRSATMDRGFKRRLKPRMPYANNLLTNSPCTSVRRKSRPWKRKVSFL
jgi:hypothetical protein